MTLEEKIIEVALLHKKNLNGGETEDEIYEAGIRAGVEEGLRVLKVFASERDIQDSLTLFMSYHNPLDNV